MYRVAFYNDIGFGTDIYCESFTQSKSGYCTLTCFVFTHVLTREKYIIPAETYKWQYKLTKLESLVYYEPANGNIKFIISDDSIHYNDYKFAEEYKQELVQQCYVTHPIENFENFNEQKQTTLQLPPDYKSQNAWWRWWR